MEQREPVLDAGAALALANRGVEQVITRGAELRHVARAEARYALLVEQHLADRQQLDRLELAGRALGLRVEGADRLQGIAEQVEPHRLLGAGGEHVDHPAADGELAAVGHGGGPHVAVDGEVAFQVGHLDPAAGPGRVARLGQLCAGRHAMQHGRDRGDHQPRRLLPVRLGQPAERRHPLRGDARRRADAVVGQAVPIGQADQLHLPREEADRFGKGGGAGRVARDEHGDPAPRLDDVGHRQGVEALRRAGQVQPPGRAGDVLEFGGFGQARRSYAPCAREASSGRNARMAARTAVSWISGAVSRPRIQA